MSAEACQEVLSTQQYPTAFCTEVQPENRIVGHLAVCGAGARSSDRRPDLPQVAPPWRCHTAMRHSCWHSAISFNLATTSLPRSSSTEERTRNSAANSSSFCWEVSFCGVEDLEFIEKSIRPKTKAFYCEAVVKPGGLVVDLEKLADIARCHVVPLIVDNTTATPYTARTSSFTVPRRP